MLSGASATDRRDWSISSTVVARHIAPPALAGIAESDYVDMTQAAEGLPDFKTQEELDAYIAGLESDMREAAKKFEFEKAARLRDMVRELRTKEVLFI